jgi:hypothetical protein
VKRILTLVAATALVTATLAVVTESSAQAVGSAPTNLTISPNVSPTPDHTFVGGTESFTAVLTDATTSQPLVGQTISASVPTPGTLRL